MSAPGTDRAGEAARYRLAIVVSHPIQYFAPLHARLAQRSDIALKVFFTWHAGDVPVRDRGFGQNIAWDIALTSGYVSELVPNTSPDPGPHHFAGLRNPTLIERIAAWRPDAAIIHGWAWLSHLQALHGLRRRGIRTLFRGDSHLLDDAPAGARRLAKRTLLKRVFSWCDGFLVTGVANRTYYEAFGVPPHRLFPCPHSIDVTRFAEPAETLDAEAARWREELGLAGRTVILFAGKFEHRKRPVELARAVLALDHRPELAAVFAGGGELQGELEAIAAPCPDRIRLLPFQNQSRMPLVYRLGDVFVLPSEHGESWGLAVNEALACGRPVIVSDRVGCAADVVDPNCGRIFPWHDVAALHRAIDEMVAFPQHLGTMRAAASRRAQQFDIAVTERTLLAALEAVCRR